MTHLTLALSLCLLAGAAMADDLGCARIAAIPPQWVCNEVLAPNDGSLGAQQPNVVAIPAPRSQSWHLLTKSYGGTVSINGGLTKAACETARKTVLAVRGEGHSESEIMNDGRQRFWWKRSDSDIETAECFQ